MTEPALGLQAASLGPIGIDPPPVAVGGSSDRALEIAARHADGWNCVVGRDDFVAKGAASTSSRDGGFGRRLRCSCATSSSAASRELVARLEHEGADTVTFVQVEEREPDIVRRLAGLVL